MRIKLDENMPLRLRDVLAELGHDVDTAMDEGLAGKADETIWSAAQATGRFLITQDLDFSDVRRFAPGTHAGLLLVRLPDNEQWRHGARRRLDGSRRNGQVVPLLCRRLAAQDPSASSSGGRE